MKIIGTFAEINFTKDLFANYCIDNCGKCFMNDNNGYGCGDEPTSIEFITVDEGLNED